MMVFLQLRMFVLLTTPVKILLLRMLMFALLLSVFLQLRMLVLLTTDRGVPPVEDTGAVNDAGRNPPAEDIAVGVLVDIGGVAWIGCLALWSPEFVSLFGN